MTIVSTANGSVHQTIALTPSLSPDIVAGLTALSGFLADRGYDLRRAGKVLDHVARNGALEGCPDLDRHHAITAESAYVGGMTAVALGDPAWGSAPGAEFFGKPADDCWVPNDVIRLDVPELLAADVADFEGWLDSLDAAGLPAVPEFAAIS